MSTIIEAVKAVYPGEGKTFGVVGETIRIQLTGQDTVEKFFEEAGRLAESGPASMEKLAELGQTYGVEFLT